MLMLVIIAANGKIKIMPDITLKQIKEMCEKQGNCPGCKIAQHVAGYYLLRTNPTGWDLKEIEERIKPPKKTLGNAIDRAIKQALLEDYPTKLVEE